MLEFGGVIYIIDLNKLSDVLVINEDVKGVVKEDFTIKTIEYMDANGKKIKEKKIKSPRETYKEMDASKYETVRYLLEVLFTYTEDVDDNLGVASLDRANISFKLAFNTLLNYGILREIK